jgi:2-polyprenyl-6-methoxyphenol hydroxylase-like FAD-dependent oxidoreductase
MPSVRNRAISQRVCVNLYQTGAKSIRTSAPRTASPLSTRNALIDAGAMGLTAAHVHSPASGQGMKTGLVDACVLGRLLGWPSQESGPRD